MTIEERFRLERNVIGQKRWSGDRPWTWWDFLLRMQLPMPTHRDATWWWTW